MQKCFGFMSHSVIIVSTRASDGIDVCTSRNFILVPVMNQYWPQPINFYVKRTEVDWSSG